MDKVNQIWHNGFIALGKKYADAYLKNAFEVEDILKARSHLSNLKEVYNSLVATKAIKKIEDLDEDQKTELWEVCKPYVTKEDKDTRLKFCKCYWAFSFLVKQVADE